MNVLPVEMIGEISSHLSIGSDLYNFSMVSKSFYNASKKRLIDYKNMLISNANMLSKMYTQCVFDSDQELMIENINNYVFDIPRNNVNRKIEKCILRKFDDEISLLIVIFCIENDLDNTFLFLSKEDVAKLIYDIEFYNSASILLMDTPYPIPV